MSERKKQHFVPRFYLKYFSNNGDKKAIGIYYIEKDKYIPYGSLKNQAYSNYFYGEDGKIEEALSQLESASADIISSILRPKQLPEHNTVGHMILLTFVVFLSARTQYTAEALNEMIDKQIKTIFREDPRVKDHLDKVEIKYENPAAFSLGVTAELVAVASDLQFKLLINETKHRFITSDNPVVKYNQFLEDKKTYGSNVGLGVKGMQILIPLNPDTYLIFYDAGVYKVGRRKHRVIRLTKERDIDELNILQVVNANRNIYFNHEVEETYILRIARKGKKFLRKRKANVAEYSPVIQTPGKNEKLIHMYNEDVRNKLKLSFVSETRRAKRYKLGNKAVHLRNPKLLEEFEKFWSQDHQYD